MEHLPYETWIVEDLPLDIEKKRALQDHLQSCEQCRQLQSGWQTARARLRSAAVVTPLPGFSQRFQSSLASRRAYQQQLQVRRTLLGLSTGAILVFISLAVYLLATTSPADWLVRVLEGLMRTITNLDSLQHIFLSWFQVLPLSLSVSIWILASSGFVILVAGWIFTMWRISMQGVTNR